MTHITSLHNSYYLQNSFNLHNSNLSEEERDKRRKKAQEKYQNLSEEKRKKASASS